ncbi:hypothetical protein AUP68_11638 [Ilyonectria robusta]
MSVLRLTGPDCKRPWHQLRGNSARRRAGPQFPRAPVARWPVSRSSSALARTATGALRKAWLIELRRLFLVAAWLCRNMSMSMACRGRIPLIPRTCGLCQARVRPVRRRIGAALPTRIRGACVCDGALTGDGCEGDSFCRYSGTKAGSVVAPPPPEPPGHPRATSGSSGQPPPGHHQSPPEPARAHQSSRTTPTPAPNLVAGTLQPELGHLLHRTLVPSSHPSSIAARHMQIGCVRRLGPTLVRLHLDPEPTGQARPSSNLS